jgi:hypothetical protein
MAGAPPQPADQRRGADEMAARIDKLGGAYSAELVAMVRACLAMDPLARPQSVFAVQKVLQTGASAHAAPAPAQEAPVSGWRGFVNRFRGQT